MVESKLFDTTGPHFCPDGCHIPVDYIVERPGSAPQRRVIHQRVALQLVNTNISVSHNVYYDLAHCPQCMKKFKVRYRRACVLPFRPNDAPDEEK